MKPLASRMDEVYALRVSRRCCDCPLRWICTCLWYFSAHSSACVLCSRMLSATSS